MNSPRRSSRRAARRAGGSRRARKEAARRDRAEAAAIAAPLSSSECERQAEAEMPPCVSGEPCWCDTAEGGCGPAAVGGACRRAATVATGLDLAVTFGGALGEGIVRGIAFTQVRRNIGPLLPRG